MQDFQPSATSLEHRAQIAKLISPLRRVTPRVPFWKLAAHRIPTLWTLYRGLLRHAERENVRDRVRVLFRENRHTTSLVQAMKQLRQGHKWLDAFQSAKAGNTNLQAILDRYDRILAVRREEEIWKERIHQVFVQEAYVRTRRIHKGSFIRQSLYNKLLPRIIPQPEHIGGMIRRRRKARERRLGVRDELRGWMDDLKRECRFELAAVGREHYRREGEYYGNALGEWLQPLRDKLKITNDALLRDIKRFQEPYSPEMLDAARRARKRKVANKTREKEREARGLYSKSTIKRMQQGPPAHVLAKMTPEQRKLYRIALGPSEGGYTAAVKLKLGMKLRKPDLWKLESGRAENLAMLELKENDIMAENERRQRSDTDEIVP
ncbi:hypothetical protein EDD16DRAFT_1482905 [Pisolithus croceorrhizus]|nr:hypothetical protein EDD16DRAFT_1482905 [Pisolithus croceorrhizus]